MKLSWKLYQCLQIMDKNTKTLAETVWTRLDRKAGAIIELTARQLRHRISTWVVLGVGVALMALLLLLIGDYSLDQI